MKNEIKSAPHAPLYIPEILDLSLLSLQHSRMSMQQCACLSGWARRL